MASCLAATLLIFVGLFMTITEARACAYERNNLGPLFVVFGVLIFVVKTAMWLLT